MINALLALATVHGCVAIDGDTLRCGSERIRLLGIDASEVKGHCRRGRVCAPGDPIASKRSLHAVLNRPKSRLAIERVGQDRYGRTLGMVLSGGVDLSCHQLSGGYAIYKRA